MALRRLALLALVSAMLLAADAGSAAAADSMTLAVNPNPAGPTQQAEVGVGVSVDASYNGGHFDVKYKPTGGSCAATPDADNGTVSPADEGQSGVSAGPFQESADQTDLRTFLQLAVGRYLICAWLTDDTTMQVVANAQHDFEVLPSNSPRLNLPTKACKTLSAGDAAAAMHSRVAISSPSEPPPSTRFGFQTWSGCEWAGPTVPSPNAHMTLELEPEPTAVSLATGRKMGNGDTGFPCRKVRGVGSAACDSITKSGLVQQLILEAVSNRLYFKIFLVVRNQHAYSQHAGLAKLSALAKKVIARVPYAHKA